MKITVEINDVESVLSKALNKDKSKTIKQGLTSKVEV